LIDLFQDIMTPGDPTSGVYVRVYYPSIHPVNETINMVIFGKLYKTKEMQGFPNKLFIFRNKIP